MLDTLSKKIGAALTILSLLGVLSKAIIFGVNEHNGYVNLKIKVAKQDSVIKELRKSPSPLLYENRITQLEKEMSKFDSSKTNFQQSFSVGFRKGKDGKKYFKSWDGILYIVYPDIQYSNDNQKYYYYIKESGQKVYCFSE